MQEPPSRKTNPRSAEEWKRKFLTETKVNQELGRRLTEMKERLHEERGGVERLRAQIDALKATPNQSESFSRSCAQCDKLQVEVTRLRSLLAQHGIDYAPQDVSPPDEKPRLPASTSVAVGTVNPLRRSASILVRQQSGKIQCLREMLDEETPRAEVIEVVRRLSIARTAVAMQPLVEEAPKTPPAAELIKPCVATPATQGRCALNNQVPGATTPTLQGIEDKSLGDLFKYAIVLTGPMQRPKKSALSAFLKAADFRRSKSQDIGSSGAGGDANSFNPARKGSVSTTQAADAAKRNGSDRLLPVSTVPAATPALAPLTVQEFATPDASRPKPSESDKIVPPASPMKRGSGWLSNIVPPRFRSASADTPPSPLTQPEAVKVQPVSSSGKPVFSLPTVAKVDTMKPRMLSVFPAPGKGGVAELEGLQEICFPYSDKLPPLSDFSVANLRRTLQERHRTYRSPDSTFVLTISSATSATDITYAVCVHLPLFPDDDSSSGGPENVDADGEKLPSHGCISLLSAYPFFSLFFKVVFGIASIWESRRKEYVQDFAIALKEKKAPPTPLTIKDFVDHFQGVMLRMKEMRVPAMGGWTRLVLAPQYTPLAFHRPHSKSVTAERRMLVLEYAAPMLFALLSVDQVLFLLGCLCCERKVLVVSDHANIVSCCVLALITLLEPLQWAGPVITLLPPRLDELLEAPVPLIAGRVSINSGAILNFSTLTKPMNGVIEMNMDQNNLCMHEEDLMRYHELKLPGCDALVHELQHLSSQLFERHLSPDFPSIEQMQACEIICSRIHQHMQSICSLATGEATTLDMGSPLFCASPRRQAPNSTAGALWTSRCSDAVQDYIQRFQDTQMFSMFKLQRQDEREEEELGLEDDTEDDEDTTAGRQADEHGSTTSDEEDGDDEETTECTETEALFADEAITYRTRT